MALSDGRTSHCWKVIYSFAVEYWETGIDKVVDIISDGCTGAKLFQIAKKIVVGKGQVSWVWRVAKVLICNFCEVKMIRSAVCALALLCIVAVKISLLVIIYANLATIVCIKCRRWMNVNEKKYDESKEIFFTFLNISCPFCTRSKEGQAH